MHSLRAQVRVKQLARRLKDGQLRVIDVPVPECGDWQVLVRTAASLVSSGTERAKVEVARESLVGKARRRPDLARQVLRTAQAEGVLAAARAVQTRLAELTPLGYCAVGSVERVGSRVRGIAPGDIVACGGEEAAHAELIAVPSNLCVPVPAGVAMRDAAFTTLGAIALHGFRQGDARVGERVGIIGLGLVGQLTARIARTAGCEVFGVDLEEWRLGHASAVGVLDAERVRSRVAETDFGTCDVVLVTAAAAGTNDPASLATDLARDRGRIVIVGDVLLNLDRRRLYAKELEVLLARSYGPGRYDTEYEQRGLDYPLAYVRWTERRNMSGFLRLVSTRQVVLEDLVTHTFPIEQADRAFDLLTGGEQRALGVVIEYEPAIQQSAVAAGVPNRGRRSFAPGPRVGFIGAGNFATRHLIPRAKKSGLVLDSVATASGLSAASVAERFGFERGARTTGDILDDAAIAGVFVATRHDRHGALALAALRAGKAVFVEKPLCLAENELDEICMELARPDAPPLMVGFNRRYAPSTRIATEHLAGAGGPTTVVLRVSAGMLSNDHWLNDPEVGGGRLLGEGCHFFDLACALVDAEAESVLALTAPVDDEPVQAAQDFTASVRFADGSLAALTYCTTGAEQLGKELVEAHRAGRSARIDDFRVTQLWGGGRSKRHRERHQDKGHSREIEVFASVVRGEAPPPPSDAYLASTAVTFAALASLETGAAVRLEPPTSAR